MSKHEVIEETPEYLQRSKTEDGTLYIETVFKQSRQIDYNEKIRNCGLFNKPKMEVHDNDDLRMWVRCPDALQWSLFKQKHAETYALMMSKDQPERVRGMRQIKLLHPEWIVFDRI